MNRGTKTTTGPHRHAPSHPPVGRPPGSLRPRQPSLLPELLGGLAGLAVASAAVVLLGTVARRAPVTAARPDDLLLTVLAWVGLLLAVWLAIGSCLALLSLVPGAAGRAAARFADHVTPLAVRRCLTLVLGASVGSLALPAAPVSTAGTAPLANGPGASGHPTAALTSTDRGGTTVAAVPGPGYAPTPSTGVATAGDTASPAYLPTSVPAPPAGPVPRATVAPTPGYVPTAPVRHLDAERSRLLSPPPRPAVATHDHVTVRRGDTLWSLAARHLGSDASDAQVATEWPRWYAVNRAVIGDDPDLLVPGQQLRPPGLADEGSAPAPTAHEKTGRGGPR